MHAASISFLLLSASLPPFFSFILSIATAHSSSCLSLVGRRASPGHGARRGEFLEDGEGSAASQPGARVWSPSPRHRRCTADLLPVLPLSLSLSLFPQLVTSRFVFDPSVSRLLPRLTQPNSKKPPAACKTTRALPLPATFSASQDSQLARSAPSTCRVFKCLSAQLV